jgi:polyhydroxyalkanoate synthesis regulator phasin
VSGVRRSVLRLIAPAMGDLLAQLERDRHRQRAEIERLEKRVAELERERARPGA